MPFFTYRARDRQGTLITGRLEATDRLTLEANLDKMGLIPIAITTARTITPLTFQLGQLFHRIKTEDLILFTRQLATLFSAGVPLTKALTSLRGQTRNPRLVDVIKKIQDDIEGGSTFAQALSRHPKVFGELYSSMVEAGETGGILEGILNRLATMAEKELENKIRIKSATLYPKIVVGAIFIAIVILMTFVVPKFAQLYASFNVPLPLPTRILIVISNLFTTYWYLILGLVAGTTVSIMLYKRTGVGRYQWDSWRLRLPIFGPIFLKDTLSRFSSTLGALYKSGLPILQSLDIVSRTVGNVVIARVIKNIEVNVRAGKNLSEPMESSRFFPPMVIQMVAVGEETGKLDEVLERVAQHYDQDVDYAIRNLTTTLEPILLSFIFFMVLFLALSIFLPMWDMVKLVRR